MDDNLGIILTIIALTCIIVTLTFTLTSVYYTFRGMTKEIEEIDCKDGVYQVLIEERDESTNWYPTERKCKE